MTSEASTDERPRKRQRSASPLTSSHTPGNGSSTTATNSIAIPPPDRWAISFFGVEPLDEFTSQVADFLYEHCRGRQHVEIEAKIGLLCPSSASERLNFPVKTECILREPSQTRFQSNMTTTQHAHFNRLLNGRVEEQNHRDYRGPRMNYQHLREIDRTWPSEGAQRGVRVTFDQKTGEVKPNSSIVKARVADLNVYSPAQPFDFRISVNVEQPAAAPIGQTKPSHERHKDRLSYQYDFLKIDLTQVTEPAKGKNATPTVFHELEIEFLRPDALVHEGENYAANEPNAFHHMVQIFLNNIRMLIRNAEV